MQYILDAMLFDISPVSDPIHSGGSPYQFTYQFANGTAPGDLWESYSGWTPMSASEKAAYRAALDQFEAVMNVQFTEVTGQADPDINVGKVNLPVFAGEGGNRYFYNGQQQITAYDGYTVFDDGIDVTNDTSLILHEIGHALGLKHPFNAPVLPAAEENGKYTVMSYDPNPDTNADPDGLQLYDIYALQSRWGANAQAEIGDTTYTGPRNSTVDAIWDQGGTDRLDASGQGTAVLLDLREGAFSRFGTVDDVVITYGTLIEDATGSAAGDDLRGNDAGNRLQGLAGNDTINGGKGRDLLLGDEGNDSLNGGKARDQLRGATGDDKLEGSKGPDKLFGGFDKDVLKGGAGNDFLDGGRHNDRLIGGSDIDTFWFARNSGRDRVMDFTDNEDILDLSDFGLGSVANALSKAQENNGKVVFKFGNGDILQVDNITEAALSDDILV